MKDLFSRVSIAQEKMHRELFTFQRSCRQMSTAFRRGGMITTRCLP